MATRPETIDRSLVEEFSIRFGDVDPLAKPVTVVDAGKLHVTGTLKPKDGVLDQSEYLNLKIGRRPIVNGRADWTVDESVESTQRLIENQWALGIKETIDKTITVDTEPGEYEVRFYAIRDSRHEPQGYLPEIYLLGEGRMTVLPRENQSTTRESTPPKK